MTLKTAYVASATFEGARSVAILPDGHRSRRLHGHSFLASIQCLMPSGIAPYPGSEVDVMRSRLETQLKKIDYSQLNDFVPVPTDENLARWVNSHCYVPSTQLIGVQSTADGGVEIDVRGHAHVWRRYAFNSVRRLEGLPLGHVCGREHSHQFEVIIHADHQIGDGDISIDYDYLGSCWAPVEQELNLANLNLLSDLNDPSSEWLSSWIWNKLKGKVVDLSRVTIYESPSCGVSFNGVVYHVWNEISFNCGIHKQSLDPTKAGPHLHLQPFLARLYFTLDAEHLNSLSVANGGAKEKVSSVFQKIDNKLAMDLEGIELGTPKGVAVWIFNSLELELPQIERVELFESRGCGVIVSSGFFDSVVPV